MYVCMYVCMYIYIYIYVCMYVYTYVCMYVCTYVCIYIRMYVCIIRTYIYIYICMYMFIYVYGAANRGSRRHRGCLPCALVCLCSAQLCLSVPTQGHMPLRLLSSCRGSMPKSHVPESLRVCRQRRRPESSYIYIYIHPETSALPLSVYLRTYAAS
jgi:hypothetical protein